MIRRLRILLASLLLAGPIVAQPAGEIRGVWLTNVDSDVLASRRSIATAMEYLADRGFNVVYPVVWNKAYTLYPSATLEAVRGVAIDPAYAADGRDPLAEILVEAQRVGLEVIPWFEYGFAAYYGQQGGPLLSARPEWAARGVTGQPVVKNGFYWMSALNPEVEAFLTDLLVEVASGYDIDGIQGDDRLPAMPVEGGYSEPVREAYRAEHGGADPPNDVRNAAWVQWRADRITDVAGRLHDAVRAIDPHLKVVFAPSVWPWSRDNYLQDWPEWLARGYGDIYHPQLYPPPPRSVDQYRTLVTNMVGDSPGSFFGYIPPDRRGPIAPGMLIKVGSDLVEAGRVIPMVEFHRSLGLRGEAFFFYEGLGAQNGNLGDALAEQVYSEPAVLPGRTVGLRRYRTRVVTAGEATRTGPWMPDETLAGFDGPAYRAEAGSAAAADYDLAVPAAATYGVYAFLPGGVDPGAVAWYRVEWDGRSEEVLVGQSVPTERWVRVATIPVTGGAIRVHVESPLDAAPPTIVADAVMALIDRRASADVYVDPTIVAREPDPVPPNGPAMTVFPNPARNRIELRAADPLSRIVLFDLLGRRVLTATSTTIDVGGLAPGLYVVRAVTTSGMTASRPVVIAR